jgi:hypothetical protein
LESGVDQLLLVVPRRRHSDARFSDASRSNLLHFSSALSSLRLPSSQATGLTISQISIQPPGDKCLRSVSAMAKGERRERVVLVGLVKEPGPILEGPRQEVDEVERADIVPL